MRCFERIRYRIYDLRSHGYFGPKETNPKTDFSGLTAHFQRVSINALYIKLNFFEKFTTLYNFGYNEGENSTDNSLTIARHDSRK